MVFHLVYKGTLGASGNSSRKKDDKHAIRRQIHWQMKALWNQMQPLKEMMTSLYYESDGGTPERGFTQFDHHIDSFRRGNYRFAPLVTRSKILACKLEVLFLRRDTLAAGLIQRGGDIDGRMKTLFDALRIPSDNSEIPQEFLAPPEGEDPFFCLLEDDSLITDVAINTGTLLIPRGSTESETDVELVIEATVKPVHLHPKNVRFS